MSIAPPPSLVDGVYRVPPMAEIHAGRGVRTHRVVSTFSGCGGACLGLTWAGLDVVWASEFIPAAQQVYRDNHPGTILDTRDIRKVTPAEILNQAGGDIDILEGSPPCAAFSTAGKRDKGWGEAKGYSDTTQRVDDLFFEFTRLLDGLQPRVFVAENVLGLSQGRARGYLREITKAMRACGYRVAVWKLDASWLGVPQQRQRLIFVGARNDLPGDPKPPAPWNRTFTVREAIGDLEGHPDNHVPPQCYPQGKMGRVLKQIKPGEKGDTVKVGSYFNWTRMHWDLPARTLLQASPQSHIHPVEHRYATIAEAKRLMGFPDDFRLSGHYRQQWERLGRAVAPPMYLAVGSQLADYLDAIGDN